MLKTMSTYVGLHQNGYAMLGHFCFSTQYNILE